MVDKGSKTAGSGAVAGAISSGSMVTGARSANGLEAEEVLDGEVGFKLFSSESDFSSQVIVLDR